MPKKIRKATRKPPLPCTFIIYAVIAAVVDRRRRAIAPMKPKPVIIIAQVADSGTAESDSVSMPKSLPDAELMSVKIDKSANVELATNEPLKACQTPVFEIAPVVAKLVNPPDRAAMMIGEAFGPPKLELQQTLTAKPENR